MEILRFTAVWCAPCRMMQPVIDFARKSGYNITDVDVSDDKNAATVKGYNITSVPTFVRTEAGIEVARKTGAMTKKEFFSFLDN